jgi:RNA polymerase sigma-70 factor (ECF subfamily)
MDADFDELFRRHYAPLVRALSVAAGREEAADAVQDAFLEAHRRWNRIARYERPDAWVRRVALNRLTDGHRRLVRRDRAFARLPAVDDSALEPSDVDLMEAVRRLPQGQRLVVCLHYLADLSVADVAEALDVSPGTVKSQLHDARRALAGAPEVTRD